MSRTAAIISILMGSCSLIFAQRITVTADAESTITGLQWGGTVGIRNAKSWALGAFYMRSENKAEVWPSTKTELYGIYVSAPLARSEKISFSAHLRAGITNHQFVVLIPGAQTRINITKHLASLVNVSWRYGHAAIGTSVMITF